MGNNVTETSHKPHRPVANAGSLTTWNESGKSGRAAASSAARGQWVTAPSNPAGLSDFSHIYMCTCAFNTDTLAIWFATTSPKPSSAQLSCRDKARGGHESGIGMWTNEHFGNRRSNAVSARRMPLDAKWHAREFIVTIQPVGAIFDPPARLTLPNVDGYSPGQEVEMFSYSHTLEEFFTVGWGTVSEDGATIRSNEYVGVVESGWHCGAAPGGSGCGHQCAHCYECDGECNCELVPKRQQENQKPDDCKTLLCDGSTNFANETGALKASKDKEGDCSTPFCNSETEAPDTQNDAADLNKNSPNWECEKCEDENQAPNPDANGSQCQDECGACVDGVCDIPEENYDKPRSKQDPADCKTLLCVDDPLFSDESSNLEDTPGDCKVPFCNEDTLSPDDENAPFDLPDTPDAECQICENKSPTANPAKQDLPCDDECGICKGMTCDIDTEKEKKTQASNEDCRIDMCGGGWEADDSQEPSDECKTCKNGNIIDDTDKIDPDQKSDNDCRVDMCGGGWEPDDGESPSNYCEMCSNGVAVEDSSKIPTDADKNDCRIPFCSNLLKGVDYEPAPDQKPVDPGYCRTPSCNGMSPEVFEDVNDLPEDDEKDCKVPICIGPELQYQDQPDGSSCEVVEDPCVKTAECSAGVCVPVSEDYSSGECRDRRYVLGLHSNVPPSAGFIDGHAWLSLFDRQTEEVITIGLWPDDHPMIVANGLDNGEGSDIRINIEPPSSDFQRFYVLTEQQQQNLVGLINAGRSWAYTYTCASFVEEAAIVSTGEDVDADDIVGFETPRELSGSILELEAVDPTSSKNPNAGGGDDGGSLNSFTGSPNEGSE